MIKILFIGAVLLANMASANIPKFPMPPAQTCDNEHLAAVQKVLTRHNKDIEVAFRTIEEQVQKKYPIKEVLKKSPAERFQLQQEMIAYAYEIAGKDIYPKFRGLVEAAIEDAKAVQVPEEYQADKNALIAAHEQIFNMVKAIVSGFEKSREMAK